MYGTLWSRLALDVGVMDYTVATPFLVFLTEAQTLRAPRAGCQGPSSLEAACWESARLGAVFWSLAAFQQPAIQASRLPGGGASFWMFMGRSRPNVLKGSGTRVRLPVAHYSDRAYKGTRTRWTSSTLLPKTLVFR